MPLPKSKWKKHAPIFEFYYWVGLGLGMGVLAANVIVSGVESLVKILFAIL
ncbi:hypothetical protein R7R25_02260 [Vibrio sp. 2026]|uniref:hypothetical protein n=1 Tax=unclassified Vibrio TaxID=2614977 RepID=UPI0029652944|nr:MULTISPECIES: hypothetical protein [unclassified Vibrio]MDW2117430.1 hypothetical protein [Vibrio sp. 2026]MDW2205949.1 hypothetical protein [Vibrio sp. 2025]